jgi:hypothetical protein
MHVMVAVDSVWRCPVQTKELVKLGLYDVLEGARKTGVKDDPSEGVRSQTSYQFTLTLQKTRGTIRHRERHRKV